MKLVFIIFVYQAYLTQKLSVLGLLVRYNVPFTNCIFSACETNYTCLTFSRFAVFFFESLINWIYFWKYASPQSLPSKIVHKYLESFVRVVNSPRNTKVTNVCNSHGQKQNKGELHVEQLINKDSSQLLEMI